MVMDITTATTILVVEGEESLRALLRRVLTRPDRHVMLAGDGSSALGLFRHSDDPIDLIISEERLPGAMSGRSLADELRRHDPSIRILLVSGNFDGPPGEFPELEKPFTFDELEQMVDETLAAAPVGRPRAHLSR